jgi:hypothetical protein
VAPGRFVFTTELPVASAATAVAAASAVASATATAAVPTAATAAFTLRASFVDDEPTTAELLVVERVDGFLGLVCVYIDEAETAAFNDAAALGAVGGEQVEEVSFARGVW